MDAASDASSDARACLLDEDGNPTYDFYESLVEVFGRFDVDGDSVLSEVELRTLSRAVHGDGREFSEDELSQIRETFEWAGGLTLQGFLQMYVSEARRSEASTWEELSRLGYDRQLALPQVCENAKFRLTRSASLQVYLERLVALAALPDCAGLVAELAPCGTTAEQRDAYGQRLRAGSGAAVGALLAGLRCCASGRDVVELEGDQEAGPVAFSFWPPAGGGGGSLSFCREGGRWRAADLDEFAPEPAAAAAAAPRPAAGRGRRGGRR